MIAGSESPVGALPAAATGDLPHSAPHIGSVSTHAPDDRKEHLELPVEDLRRLARPMPPHDEVIEDLTEEEGAAFLAAVES